MKVTIINGPNLNLLGKRETDIYGNQNFEEFLAGIQREYFRYEIDYFQSNIEGELINKLHEVGFTKGGIIFNPGGYSHTSVALGDAVAAIETPVIEVHISNTMAREEFRHYSFVSPHAKGIIIGMGMEGYRLALKSLLG